MSVKRAIEAIDHLLGKSTGFEDLLLDTRLHLARGSEPGICVSNYFILRKHLPPSERRSLEALKSGLETGIALEIIAADARRRQCLGLGDAYLFEEYCQEQMKQTALKHRESSDIHMRFCWNPEPSKNAEDANPALS